MKRIIFMAALALSFSACDNTKLQLRAAGSDNKETAVSTATSNSDTLLTDTVKRHSLVVH